MRIFAALFFVAIVQAAAQTPEVPHKMEFAGIRLTIRDDARREIQKDVDALTVSPRHFNIKVERAKTYFPIIEKIFAEEQVPDDFKFLVLQESALIADAVSVSNAVGFWQFKDFTALEMGLRVDKEIDERLNIVSSTRAAARYLKKNNSFFDNWLYALQAYQSGAGGVMKAVKDTQSGARHMEITSQTYWYVKKYLAHKIAYESAVKGKGTVSVLTLNTSGGKSLTDLAKEVAVSEAELKTYNKWTKSGSIPADRSYTVIIPVAGETSNAAALASLNNEQNDKRVTGSSVVSAAASVRKKINGIQAIQAQAGETSVALAARGGVGLTKFLQWNDLNATQPLVAGSFYFLGKKRKRAIENFHKLSAGETLWEVSQRYGVQLKRLKKFNRIKYDTEVAVGTMLYLASTRPKSDPVLKPIENAVAVSDGETFNWEATPSVVTASKSNDTVTLPAESIVLPVSDSEVNEAGDVTQSDSIRVPVTPVVVVDSVASAETITVISKKEYHTVQAKETLYGIAKLYNVGVMDLVKWNNLDLQQGIKPGQELRLSESQPEATEPMLEKPLTEVLHEVKSSDTLYSIARQYGVTIKQIMDWNQKKDFSLAVGEKLRIQQR